MAILIRGESLSDNIATANPLRGLHSALPDFRLPSSVKLSARELSHY